MKKIMGPLIAVLFVVFIVGVFAIVMSLSYKALGLIFPNDLLDQAVGLVLFDIGALIWFGVFVYQSKSIMQYVFSALGFLIGLGGTAGLVAMEVGISSGQMVAADVMKPLTYIFIGVAVGHVILIYATHASSPEVDVQISLGVESAKITAEGMRQAEQQLIQRTVQLGGQISKKLVDDVVRDLNLPGNEIDGKFVPIMDDVPMPVGQAPAQKDPVRVFPLSFRWPWLKKNDQRSASVKSADARIVDTSLSQGEVEDDSTVITPASKKPIASE